MRKPRIKRVYSNLFGDWYWCVSFPYEASGWQHMRWQENRAFAQAQAFVDDLNRKQIRGN